MRQGTGIYGTKVGCPFFLCQTRQTIQARQKAQAWENGGGHVAANLIITNLSAWKSHSVSRGRTQRWLENWRLTLTAKKCFGHAILILVYIPMFGYFPLSWDDNSTSTRDSHELFLGQVQISILASNYIKSFSDHPHWRNHHLHLSLIVFSPMFQCSTYFHWGIRPIWAVEIFTPQKTSSSQSFGIFGSQDDGQLTLLTKRFWCFSVKWQWHPAKNKLPGFLMDYNCETPQIVFFHLPSTTFFPKKTAWSNSSTSELRRWCPPGSKCCTW